MTEYIERKAAINALKKDVMGGLNYEHILNNIAAAEVRPIVHGKWLKDYKMPTCSICGNAVPFPDQYCSNCGSKMDLDIADYVDERGCENGFVY